MRCRSSLSYAQSACAPDIANATAAARPGASTAELQAQLDMYTSNPEVASVSASCCTASEKLNNAKCNCYESVVRQGALWFGGSVTTYNQVASLVAEVCGFEKIC
ncbi:hypothetical protein FOA52_010548 [Chlamydomonas sp. UWO 241]|nr:hypothetical protein FOA52_010548 [Chlamydomonas sp. UWO 241]